MYCYVCLETCHAVQQQKSVYLWNIFSLPLYISSCECQWSVHEKCLYTWYKQSHKCPICKCSIVRVPE